MARALGLICLFILVLSVSSFARTWNISANGSGDAPTIQAGIDSAAAGDTVFLADGTYSGDGNRDISFRGKAVTVSGNENQDCIIDCEGSAAHPHTGFIADLGESVTTVLSQVTIRNGYYDAGGGLVCAQSGGRGGCPVITNCAFENNTAENDGGAIMAFDYASPLIGYCRFSGNTAGTYGGAMAIVSGGPAIVGCEFQGNSAYMGGALRASAATLSISYCNFYGNWSSGSDGGAMDFQWCSVMMLQCTSSGNRSPFTGGSIHANNTSLYITGSTFAADSSGEGAIIAFRGDAGSFTALKTVMAYGRNSSAVHCFPSAPTPAFSCCDVFGNSLGDWVDCLAGQNGTNSNFSQDPLICDIKTKVFGVETCSPCLPANNSCGHQVGAWGEWCACGQATVPTTWGAIKAKYK
jgi:predicted outer membrane repeat protein